MPKPTANVGQGCLGIGALQGILQFALHIRLHPFQLHFDFGDDSPFGLLDVGVNAVAFDHPLALRVDEAEFGYVYVASINQRPAVGDADHAAPRALEQEWCLVHLLGSEFWIKSSFLFCRAFALPVAARIPRCLKILTTIDG